MVLAGFIGLPAIGRPAERAAVQRLDDDGRGFRGDARRREPRQIGARNGWRPRRDRVRRRGLPNHPAPRRHPRGRFVYVSFVQGYSAPAASGRFQPPHRGGISLVEPESPRVEWPALSSPLCPAQAMPVAQNLSRPEALLKKMTLDEKIGQLVQRAGGRSKALNSRLDDAELERVRAGQVGSYLHVAGAEPWANCRKSPSKNRASVFRCCLPWTWSMAIARFPGAARAGGDLGAGERGTRRARGGRRSHFRRAALDVRAHDRHRARSALGPHRRRRRRRSVSRRAHGRGAGERLPGRQHCCGPARSWRRPSISARTAPPSAAATTTARTSPSARCRKSIYRRSMPRRAPAPVRSWRRSTTSPACPPPPTRICCAACCVNAGAGRGSWSATGARSASSSITAWRRIARPRRRWRSMLRWTWTWWAACSPMT